MAKNKLLPYVLFGLPLAIGAYFVIKSMRERKKEQEPQTPSPTPSARPVTPITTAPTSGAFPLRKGSKGSKVSELQQAIIARDKTLLPRFGVDGDFGSETEAAVLKLLGKKSVDSQAEIDSINPASLASQRRDFPLIFPQTPPNQLVLGVPFR